VTEEVAEAPASYKRMLAVPAPSAQPVDMLTALRQVEGDWDLVIESLEGYCTDAVEQVERCRRAAAVIAAAVSAAAAAAAAVSAAAAPPPAAAAAAAIAHTVDNAAPPPFAAADDTAALRALRLDMHFMRRGAEACFAVEVAKACARLVGRCTLNLSNPHCNRLELNV